MVAVAIRALQGEALGMRVRCSIQSDFQLLLGCERTSCREPNRLHHLVPVLEGPPHSWRMVEPGRNHPKLSRRRMMRRGSRTAEPASCQSTSRMLIAHILSLPAPVAGLLLGLCRSSPASPLATKLVLQRHLLYLPWPGLGQTPSRMWKECLAASQAEVQFVMAALAAAVAVLTRRSCPAHDL